MISLNLNSISKNYPQGKQSIPALADISLSAEKAEIIGIIGPDGAGKTTLFRILTTLLLPSSGTGSIHGYDLVDDFRKIRHLVGYMPGRFSLYEDLSVRENLDFFARLFNTTIEENYDQIKDIYHQLEPFKNRRAGKLSGGMKQKLALSCALIHQPKYLFLDEPTTGVDPVSRAEFWDMLKELKDHGLCIIVSTPYMDEAALCDRIAFIHQGRILNTIYPDSFLRDYDPNIYQLTGNKRYHLVRDVRNYPHTKSCLAFGESHHLKFSHSSANEPASLIRYLEQMGHTEYQIDPIRANLEDYFLDLLNPS